MTEVFIYALAISTIFFLFKFIEMKFVADDDKKPLKVVVKESLFEMRFENPEPARSARGREQKKPPQKYSG